MAITPACPKSATHGLVAALGLAAFLAAIAILRTARPFGDDAVLSSAFVLLLCAVVIAGADLLWQQVHRRASTGINFKHDAPSWERCLTKLLGLAASLGFVAFFYWLFPEYHSGFYRRYYELLEVILPFWLCLAIPYFYFVDRHMPQPHDGYWHLGKLLALQYAKVDRRVIGQHLLGWGVKGFFLPLMFVYMCNGMAHFLAVEFARLDSFMAWFVLLHDSLYFIDVALATLGYLVSLRIIDTHLRSAEPTMLGWVVALACYEPFWSLIGHQYLAYETGLLWDRWLSGQPLLQIAWGSAILLLIVVYVWATVIFGARFSNLTHRGIITNGPYRWTKHPAYVAKNLSWWLIAVPFIVQGSPAETLRHCLLLLGLNGIYLLRAKTEEWHLSRDADYVRYALWMEQRSVFRFLRRIPLLKWLCYRQPRS